jgi:4-aminobutyrate aminotransferase-like enzyme
MGLVQGVELVRDRKTQQPAVKEERRLMDLAMGSSTETCSGSPPL